jgi:hypothetical protein
MTAEHSPRIPPTRAIHLAVTGDDQAEPEEAVQVDHLRLCSHAAAEIRALPRAANGRSKAKRRTPRSS